MMKNGQLREKSNPTTYGVKKFALVVLVVLAALGPMHDGSSEERAEDGFRPAFDTKNYSKAYEIIQGKLLEIYGKRVDDKRVPSDAITPRKLEESLDLNRLFKKRSAGGFFEEDNPTLHELHIFGARSLYNMERFDGALNHYYQALRFKTLKFGEDDRVFYEIALVYRKMGHPAAYVRALEAAYTLEPGNREYSLLIGRALSRGGDHKKAIFHLERYVEVQTGKEVDPGIYLTLGNLNEETGRYLETVRWYKEYLRLKPEDGYIQFALGHLCTHNTGDHRLALASLGKALEILPETEFFRKAKASEYMADIFLMDLEYGKAVEYYEKVIQYQSGLKAGIDRKTAEIEKAQIEIRAIKTDMIKNRDSRRYSEYEYLQTEKGKLEQEKRESLYAFNKLNAGKVRWNMAVAMEKLEKPEKAITYYRECIGFNYQANSARERIQKIQLKINRGY